MYRIHLEKGLPQVCIHVLAPIYLQLALINQSVVSKSAWVESWLIVKHFEMEKSVLEVIVSLRIMGTVRTCPTNDCAVEQLHL